MSSCEYADEPRVTEKLHSKLLAYQNPKYVFLDATSFFTLSAENPSMPKNSVAVTYFAPTAIITIYCVPTLNTMMVVAL